MNRCYSYADFVTGVNYYLAHSPAKTLQALKALFYPLNVAGDAMTFRDVSELRGLPFRKRGDGNTTK
jgi:hypothetical protein